MAGLGRAARVERRVATAPQPSIVLQVYKNIINSFEAKCLANDCVIPSDHFNFRGIQDLFSVAEKICRASGTAAYALRRVGTTQIQSKLY